MKSTTQFPDRNRFNWGYHDGANDLKAGRENKWAQELHYDEAYRSGYLAGFTDAKRKRYHNDSTLAWDMHQLYAIA